MSFADAPGGSLDWIGIYDADEVPDGSPFAVNLSLNDGYQIAATDHFSVTGRRC